MRVTKRTNIAMRLLMYCAANPGKLVTKAQVAERCNASENHLAQVVNQLAQLGFIHTQRGRNGGLMLARDPAAIHVGDVFRAIEGLPGDAGCFADSDNSCPLSEACRLRIALQDAAEAFFAHLDDVTLDALVCGNGALAALLTPPACGAVAAEEPAEPAAAASLASVIAAQ